MPEETSPHYIVTARKWRPQRFADVVGQEHVTRTLRNAVQSGRIHHAYIFNGPRGVGKTTTARIIAKAVNCERLNADTPTADFEPCDECPSCLEINSGRSMDVIEIDGASNNSVEDIRKLRENARYPPIRGKYKMYIIDEVHMLSTSAFNALLKTLEEPPKHLLFVFATTEPHKVPATILSRCQRFDFRRMQVDEIATQLRYIADQEGISIDEESLAVIGKKGDGSMRDSQSIFDQIIAFCGKNVEYTRVNEALNLIDQEFYFTLSRAIREHDVAQILDIAREVFVRGYDLQECLGGLAEHFRNILTVLATGDTRLVEASKLHREHYQREAAEFTQADVLNFMSIIITTDRELRYAPQPRLRFEFALVQMAKMESAVNLKELLDELAELQSELKKKLNDDLNDGQNGFENSALLRLLGASSNHSSPSPQKPLSEPFPKPVSQLTPEPVPEPVPQEIHKPRLELVAEPIKEPAREPITEPAPHIVIKPSTATNFSLKESASEEPNSDENDESIHDQSIERHDNKNSEIANPVSAERLATEWLERLRGNENLDSGLQKYLLGDSSLVDIRCGDGEFYISSAMSFIADSFASHRKHLEDLLREAFGAPVRVIVEGGSQIEANSLFGDFLLEKKPAKPAVKTFVGKSTTTTVSPKVEASTPFTPSALAVQSAPSTPSVFSAATSATSEPPSSTNTLASTTTQHELDKAIIDIFQAVPTR